MRKLITNLPAMKAAAFVYTCDLCGKTFSKAVAMTRGNSPGMYWTIPPQPSVPESWECLQEKIFCPKCVSRILLWTDERAESERPE